MIGSVRVLDGAFAYALVDLKSRRLCGSDCLDAFSRCNKADCTRLVS